MIPCNAPPSPAPARANNTVSIPHPDQRIMFRLRGYRFQDDPYIATVTAMSVIPPTAIFLSTTLIVSFVPRTDIRQNRKLTAPTAVTHDHNRRCQRFRSHAARSGRPPSYPALPA